MSRSIPITPAGHGAGHPPIQLARGSATWPHSHDEDWQDEAVAEWQAHLAAGRIGNNPPCPPAVAAQREANDALFRGIARDRQRLAQIAARR